jgi:tRNA-dihydrouridine synthase
MRKHLLWYCRNLPGAAELRAPMVRVKSAADVEAILDNYIKGIGQLISTNGLNRLNEGNDLNT